ncbi:hypothetical protein QJQ45_019119 [Haematococcus lacustris]|nr:hypothetical protein QJQ45_019119 [Haematococcus lacustris]
MERHGHAKQLVVVFGAASIGTGGGWGADTVLRACCKVVCRARGTDQLRGRVVLVDEHRTSRVSSAVNGQQPCEEELDHEQSTRRAGWKPPKGQAPRSSQEASPAAASEPGPSTPPPAKRSKRTKAEQAAELTEPTEGKGKRQGKAARVEPAPQPGRWLDRDCNAALTCKALGRAAAAAAAAAAAEEGSGDEGVVLMDRDEMHDMIARAYAAADERMRRRGRPGLGGAEQARATAPGKPCHAACGMVLWMMMPAGTVCVCWHEALARPCGATRVPVGMVGEAPALEVEVAEGDALDPAGCVLSVLEGVVVVQGLVNSRALAEGSVLVLDETRQAIGRIEEVFGPVTQPFYALRWSSPGPPPPALKPGARLASLARCTERIAPEMFVGHERPVDYDPGVEVEEEEEEEEVYFSDDEAEAAYTRKLQMKRKAEVEAGVATTGQAAPRGSPTAAGRQPGRCQGGRARGQGPRAMGSPRGSGRGRGPAAAAAGRGGTQGEGGVLGLLGATLSPTPHPSPTLKALGTQPPLTTQAMDSSSSSSSSSRIHSRGLPLPTHINTTQGLGRMDSQGQGRMQVIGSDA